MNKITEVIITAYVNGDYRITFRRPSAIHAYWTTGRKVAQHGILIKALMAKPAKLVRPYFCKYFISITYQF